MADEHKMRHLDFLHLTITRMAANSFLLKAWSVTLVAALFALAAKDADLSFVLVAYVPVIMFWILDGYYLSQERLFRGLYDIVRNKTEDEIDFSLKTDVVPKSGKSWVDALVSKTILPFYGCILAVIVAATVITGG